MLQCQKVVQGSIIAVDKFEDKLRLTISSNTLDGRILIKASSRGMDYLLIEGHLREGKLRTELAADKLPEGIIVFTLMNEARTPFAERLYFNELAGNRLQMNLKTDDPDYEQREETQLSIQLKSDTDKLPAVDMSVLILNKEQWHSAGATISFLFSFGFGIER